MSDNNHLDLSVVRDQNEYWFEEIDLYNPFQPDPDCDLCSGTGSMGCECCLGDGEVYEVVDQQSTDNLITCTDCGGSGEVKCKSCDLGDEDNDPDELFDILWDTAFNIPYLKSGLDYSEARRIAWSMGWLLFEYDNEYWIASGSCGYDFTWRKAQVALALCGNLPIYYAEQLSNGGYVFVTSEERTQIASAAAESFDNWMQIYMSNRDRMAKIASYGAEVEDIYKHERDLAEADRRINKQATRSQKVDKGE